MKFVVEKAGFQKAISRIEGIISAREIRSVISSILIETGDDSITLTATDLDISMKTTLSAKIATAGSITAPAKKLSQIIKEFRFETVELDTDKENKISIRDGSSQAKTEIHLMGAPADEFMLPSPIKDSHFKQFPPALVNEMIRRTSYAIAEEDARYVFNGLYMESEGDQAVFVGTDGRRLARIARNFPDSLPVDKGVVVPVKAIRELTRLIGNVEEGFVGFDKEEGRLYFKLGDVELITRLIDGNFPDYRQVIPRKLDHEVRLNREALRLSLRQAAVLAAEPSRQIRLEFSPGTLVVSSSTPDLGNVNDPMSCEYQGEEVTIAFNSNYLLDVLGVLNSEDILLGFSTASAPTVIKDPDDGEFVAVVMPMKI
ncbi:MAG: DNA polymerase III subunit beta [Spirochaetaceae bacterium]|nr:DNA polymerase III subunit beta [Spirochaetaceae bacterium]|tara:strand:+ start:39707 stop:40822 length:1116 start_codon:yes stop_codon:yes gene_type:complete